jgi:hypothetical protein
MRRFIISLFCLFFLLSGPISAWAGCFRRSHAGVDEQHHHGGASDSIHHTASEHDHSASRIHCPQLRFDIESLASLAGKTDPKPRDHQYKLVLRADVSTEQISLKLHSGAITGTGRFPSYPFLVGLSPYLLLSVFRI